MKGLPLDNWGTVTLPKLPLRPIIDSFLKAKSIKEEFLAERFFKLTQDFIEGVVWTD